MFLRRCSSLDVWRSSRRDVLARVIHPIRFVVVEVENDVMENSLTPSRKVDNDDDDHDDLDGDDDVVDIDTGP
jgi:hypothetical protein